MIVGKETSLQAFRYFQAAVAGTLANFFSRFLFAEWMEFGWSVIIANYVGMIIVFLFSYKRAFGAAQVDGLMIGKFALVAHGGLLLVWGVSTGTFQLVENIFPMLLSPETVYPALNETAAVNWGQIIKTGTEGCCHGIGISVGFLANFIGHKRFSFAAGQFGIT
ncbi:GtrA family protein [Desulfococcus multivorans]|uniref:GtrA family protein n=1 Tax=Desulfococcus multivorans DSM 2059 TaxID=1121405 RepID=S7TLH4_DESML|nr:GtrA family protein [Desulfococcus multivorans]AOY58724.1 conserved uncharacterized protein, GtrA family [Desulfococcus multivorans]AQV01007.1 hypothetical protein B2D07_09675 [Desulfococcus multivorans]EPR37726.1 GtrA family protein [Desulfococcus multivorans DSM 2059]SJZ47079.1 GtrA-like protein [Desulfococcus multivorans DSM 2059]